MARQSASKQAGLTPQVVQSVESRLKRHAKAKWPACKAVSVRSRGRFLYVDAQDNGDSQPEPLCRLRYMGTSETWEFAYFTWSREAYEPSVLDTGLPFGTPEDCFDAAAFGFFGPR